jgi:L-alanine-DL-glutamate epimerase-like enolase superfamily enzyme
MVGESITSHHMFRDFIAARAVGILQPDALKLGGISGWLAAAALAPAHGIPLIPAVWDMMQVHVHLCAGVEEVLMMEYIPWILHIFERPVTFEGGFLRVPQEPGIGTEIRADALERYAVC